MSKVHSHYNFNDSQLDEAHRAELSRVIEKASDADLMITIEGASEKLRRRSALVTESASDDPHRSDGGLLIEGTNGTDLMLLFELACEEVRQRSALLIEEQLRRRKSRTLELAGGGSS